MKNALSSHGPLRLSSNHHYITYADGTPFFWLADTWWYAGTKRLTYAMLKTLLSDRTKKGFTVVLLVIGAPPEVDPLSSEAEGASGLAFMENGATNAEYFDGVDPVIRKIIASGIVPCIVGSWGQHIDQFGVDAMKRLWAEIISRWGNLPVVFCLTGEVDGSMSDTPKQRIRQRLIRLAKRLQLIQTATLLNITPKLLWLATDNKTTMSDSLNSRISKWEEVVRFIKKTDKNHRLLTVHPQRKLRASELFHNSKWLDIDTIQSGHTTDNAGFLVSAAMNASHSTLPFINLEPWYEKILGNFGPSHQRYAFWMSVLSGAKGHTYGAHGIWQLANGDNFMSHWGNSDWRTALGYKGSKQIGLAKKFLAKYSWWTFRPSPFFIAPAWKSTHPFRPLAAIDCDNRIWIYVPCIGTDNMLQYEVRPSKTRQKYRARYIDPSTMRTIKKRYVQTPLHLVARPKQDCLILLENPHSV